MDNQISGLFKVEKLKMTSPSKSRNNPITR